MTTRHAIATGKIWDTVDCYVLDNGMRVLSKNAAASYLVSDVENRPAKQHNLDRYLSRIPEKFRPKTEGPNIEFKLASGGHLGQGIQSETFVEILNAYVSAFMAGELRANQVHLAQNAHKLLETFAAVGLTALIDEATGHQKQRPVDELQRLVNQLLRQQDDFAEWELLWDHELVRVLAPLWGVSYAKGRYPVELRRFFGWFYDTVLSPLVAGELRRRTGTSVLRHQGVTDECRKAIAERLDLCKMLAKQARNRYELMDRISSFVNGTPFQLRWE